MASKEATGDEAKKLNKRATDYKLERWRKGTKCALLTLPLYREYRALILKNEPTHPREEKSERKRGRDGEI